MTSNLMRSAAPRRTGPRVLIQILVTTVSTMKTYSYPAEGHVIRAAAESVSVPLASTLYLDTVQAVHPTATQ